MIHLVVVEGIFVLVTLATVLLGAIAPCRASQGKLIEGQGPVEKVVLRA